jgi:putative transposase
MMKNRHLSRSIADCKFYEIRRQLEYKCKWNNINLILVDRWFPSSKMCNICGQIKSDLKLSDRVYKCDCGNSEDRDVNASKNIRDFSK